MSTQAKVVLLGVLVLAVVGVLIWDRSTMPSIKKGPDLARRDASSSAADASGPVPVATLDTAPPAQGYTPVSVSPGPTESGPNAAVVEIGGSPTVFPEGSRGGGAPAPSVRQDPAVDSTTASAAPASHAGARPVEEPAAATAAAPAQAGATEPGSAARTAGARTEAPVQPAEAFAGKSSNADPGASPDREGSAASAPSAPAPSAPLEPELVSHREPLKPAASDLPAQNDPRNPPQNPPHVAPREPAPANPPAASPEPAAAPAGVLGGVNYTVQPGDHLWGIAQKFYHDGNRFNEIFEANKDVLANANTTLVVGAVLRIPEVKPPPPSTPAAAPVLPAGQKSWTVHQGDTLVEISKKVYGSSRHWRAIAEANKKELPDPDHPKVGQLLVLPEIQEKSKPTGAPGATPAADEPTGKDVYTIKEGDLLENLADRFYHDRRLWMKILEANPSRLKDPQSLRVGQKIVIPGVDVGAEPAKGTEAPKAGDAPKGAGERRNPPPAPEQRQQESSSLGTPVHQTSLIDD
ncbi:MAG: LysM peptidoglycan-binding domain-containing protein [Planctomycetes bacterium]|nr:LysM peptidoglycan-binding domain-containing protein [Planctomycetota bacterium]